MIPKSVIPKSVMVATCVLALTMQPGNAGPLPGDLRQVRAMSEGAFALAPLSFVRFCLDAPAECQAHGGAALVTLDAQKWETLNTVNLAVNERIVPDPTGGGLAAWSLTATRGDCNDYAVQKRHELLVRGWPASALALAVVVLPGGQAHLVLSVRTDRGDVVLDNLRDAIVAWDKSGYRWLKRQSADEPRFWVDVSDPNDRAVATLAHDDLSHSADALPEQ